MAKRNPTVFLVYVDGEEYPIAAYTTNIGAQRFAADKKLAYAHDGYAVDAWVQELALKEEHNDQA